MDCILAEDTRTVRVLLDRYGIRAPLRSYHDHNKESVAPAVIREIGEGKRFALVSDAGTPLISDPGYYIVRRLIDEGVAFTAVPGASAVTTALVLSGLPPDRFTFYGVGGTPTVNLDGRLGDPRGSRGRRGAGAHEAARGGSSGDGRGARGPFLEDGAARRNHAPRAGPREAAKRGVTGRAGAVRAARRPAGR